MAVLNTICAVSADSSEDTRSLLERMTCRQSGDELDDNMWHVDESGLFGIAASGNDSGNTFYHDPTKRIAIAFCGRISNAGKLENAFKKEGEPPTKGFAELVGRLFDRFGAGCVDRLHGYFNFIVWDGKNNRILAFRDQTGSLPLYYSTGNNSVRAVASRVEALVGSGIAQPSLDHEAIYYFLCDKAFTSTETPFSQVRGIRAGECILLDRSELRTENYYLMPIQKQPMNEEEAIDRADEILIELLEEYTEHFSEIGLLLSGGVDSMLLLSSLRSVTNKPIHTYSIAVDASGKDIEYTKRASEHFGTEHTELVIDENYFRDNVLNLIASYPTPGVGGWHVYLGTVAAEKHGIRSMICGFGGELVFGIPAIYRNMEILHRILHFLDPRKPLDRNLLEIIGWSSGLLSHLTSSAHLLRQYSDARLGVQRWYGSKLNEKRARDLLADEIGNSRKVREKYLGDHAKPGTNNLIDMLNYTRMRNFEGNKVLGMSTHLANRNGVELINPLLDRRMVEYGFSIPHKLKSLGGQYRHIEVSLANRYHNFKREKSAFIAPFDKWLRSSLPAEAKIAFDPAAVAERGIFFPEKLESLWAEFQRGESDLKWPDIFTIISVEMWLRSILDA